MGEFEGYEKKDFINILVRTFLKLGMALKTIIELRLADALNRKEYNPEMQVYFEHG